jgi:hypothetical protein
MKRNGISSGRLLAETSGNSPYLIVGFKQGMEVMKKLIGFRSIKKNCAYEFEGMCAHGSNKTTKPFNYGKCSQTHCPIWKQLSKPNASNQPRIDSE